MNRCITLGRGVAATILLSLPLGVAQAADLSLREPFSKSMPSPFLASFDWTGFYVGINGAYGFGSSRHNFAAAGTMTNNYTVSGMLVGGTLGYNWQHGNYVLGGEGDFGWSNIKGSAPCPNPAFTCGTQNNWLGTARGRLGYAFDRWLPFVTAGGAAGDIKATISPSAAFPGATETRFGWTVGAGLEYAALTSWSVKAEYLYVDLGSMNCGRSCTLTGTDNVNFNAHVVRAGVNYRF